MRAVVEREIGPQQVQLAAQLRIDLMLACGVDNGTRRRLGMREQRIDGLRTHGTIGRLQHEAARCAVHLRTQGIVQCEGLQIVGFDGNGLTRNRIEVALAVLAHHASGGRVEQRIVLQRLQDRSGLLRRRGGQCVECLHLGIEVIFGQGLEIGLGERASALPSGP